VVQIAASEGLGEAIFFKRDRDAMIHWKPAADYVEPNWVKLGTDLPPTLFWRPKQGATLGYIRDGELFDAKWIYVCDSNKVSNFSTVNPPGDNIVNLETRRGNANPD
jgi:hypothetical protein